MLPRGRRKVLVLSTVLGLPGACILVVAVFLWTGGLERRLAAAFAERFPGACSVESVSLASTEEAVVSGLRIDGAGGSVDLVTVDQLSVHGDLLAGKVARIELGSMVIDAGAAALPDLRQLVEGVRAFIASQPPGDGAPLAIGIDSLRIDAAQPGAIVGKELTVRIEQGQVRALQGLLEGLGNTIEMEVRPDGHLELTGTLRPRAVLSRLIAGAWLDWDPELPPLLPEQVTLGIDASLPTTPASAYEWELIAEDANPTGALPVQLLRSTGSFAPGRLRGEVEVGWERGLGSSQWSFTALPGLSGMRAHDFNGSLPVPALIASLMRVELVNPAAQLATWFLPHELRWQDCELQVSWDEDIRFGGRLGLDWDAGQLRGRLVGDLDQAVVEHLRLEDAGWGSIVGQFAAEPGRNGKLAWQQLKLGPTALAILASRPYTHRIIEYYPDGDLSWSVEREQLESRLTCYGEGGSVWSLEIEGEHPNSVQASKIPIHLADGLFTGLQCSTGSVDSLTAQRDDSGVWQLDAAISDATLAFAGYGLQELDAQVSMQLDENRLHQAELIWLGADDTRLAYRLLADGGHQVDVRLADLERIGTQIDLPFPMPPLIGSMQLRARLAPTSQLQAWRIQELRWQGLGVGSLLSGGDGEIAGTVVIDDGQVEADLEGLLRDGAIRLDAGTLDLSDYAPAFKVAASLRRAQRDIRLRPLLLRGPEGAANPRYGVSLRGELHEGQDGVIAGSLQLVVDPLDVALIEEILQSFGADPVTGLQGRSSLVLNLAHGENGLELLDGHMLQFGNDLIILDGRLRLAGVQGSVHLPRQQLPVDLRKLKQALEEPVDAVERNTDDAAGQPDQSKGKQP